MTEFALSDPAHPARRWVVPQHFQWAQTDDAIADFLQSLDRLVRDFSASLGGDPVPVLGGWGGALVRVRRPSGDLAVKIPFLPSSVSRQAAEQEVLQRAGLCPRVVDVQERWFAMDWIDAQPAGKHLLPYELDHTKALDVLERLASLQPTTSDERDRVRRHTQVPPHRRELLRLYDLDPDRVDERVASVREELFDAASRTCFLHGDLQGGNILSVADRWLTVDPQVRSDGQEQEVAWLLAGALCGRIPTDTLALFAGRLGLESELIDYWSMVYSAEWLTCVLDSFPDRTLTAGRLAANLSRLCA